MLGRPWRRPWPTPPSWFQTPETLDRKGNYRSIATMRPLAIWAMQWAWQRAIAKEDNVRYNGVTAGAPG